MSDRTKRESVSEESNPCGTMRLDQAISRDPDVVSGALVFKGTRVPVQTLIDYLKSDEKKADEPGVIETTATPASSSPGR